VADVAQTVIDLERRRLQALVDQNYDNAKNIMADDLVYTHGSADVDNKQSYLEKLAIGHVLYQSIEQVEVNARVLHDDAVVLTGTLEINVLHEYEEQVTCKFSEVYVKRGGDWKMLLFHATKAKTVRASDRKSPKYAAATAS
jgi:hypothetical protein